jgi:hypothetical protein
MQIRLHSHYSKSKVNRMMENVYLFEDEYDSHQAHAGG